MLKQNSVKRLIALFISILILSQSLFLVAYAKDEVAILNAPDSDLSMVKVYENQKMALYIDNKTAEFQVLNKINGQKIRSNPINFSADTIAKDKWKSNLRSQIIFTYTNESGSMEDISNSRIGSVNKGGMSITKISKGFKVMYDFPELKVKIPLVITLQDDFIKAEIPSKQIENKNPDLFIKNISLLPFFGATDSQTNGYMVVPDGSGALINMNNSKTYAGIYSLPIYGNDASISINNKTNITQSNTLPVFGIKTDNQSILAVINKGDAVSSVNAYINGMVTNFNNVFITFNLRTTDFFSITDRSGKTQQIPVINKNKLVFDSLEIRYYPLQGDENNYLGMADRYKKFLIEEKGAKEKKGKLNTDLYLDLYGGVLKKKSVFGIPITDVVPLTTYKGAEKIVRSLKSSGIDNITIHYSNVTKANIKKSYSDKFKYNSKIGNENDYKNLLNTVGEGKIYTSVDMVNMKNYGWILKTLDSTVKNPIGLPSYQNIFNLATTFKDSKKPLWYLLSPELVGSELSKYFINTTKTKYGKNIAVEQIGSNVYSNNGKKNINREQAAIEWQKALITAKKSGASLMVSNGNAYTIPYSDKIMNVPTSSNGYLLTDVSIPFVQLAIRGLCDYSSPSINQSSNPHESFLSAIESGSSLQYSLIYEDPSILMGTQLQWLYSSNFSKWEKTIVSDYKAFESFNRLTNTSKIIKHEIIGDNIIKVSYSNGISVVINYNNETKTIGNLSVDGKNYVILKDLEVIKSE